MHSTDERMVLCDAQYWRAYGVMRCTVLTQRMPSCACYAMSGADIAYGATAGPSSDLGYDATRSFVLIEGMGVPGEALTSVFITKVPYPPTSALGCVRYFGSLGCYATLYCTSPHMSHVRPDPRSVPHIHTSLLLWPRSLAECLQRVWYQPRTI
eukprot:3845758-Rhodomonas_salina.1